MSTPTSVKLLSAAAALALLAGCSSGSSIAPSASSMQSHHVVMNSGRIPTVLNPVGMLKLRNLGGFQPNHKASFNACPASGPIVYMSDFNTSTINIYKVPFAGQGPCGQLTGLANPQGMFVRRHVLYVANTGFQDVVAFHRGATAPFQTYTDPTCSGQFAVDVTVGHDGYVYATNIFGGACAGSISSWKKDGTYVGTIPNANGANDYFLTIQKDGTMYTDDNTFALYTASCSAGTCGSFSNTGATFAFPGGLRSADGEDVVLDDQSASGGGALVTYEPPSFGSGDSCAIGGSDPVSFDINHRQHHAFIADAGLNEGIELGYPGCAPIGTVPGNSSGLPIGMAKDYPETLH